MYASIKVQCWNFNRCLLLKEFTYLQGHKDEQLNHLESSMNGSLRCVLVCARCKQVFGGLQWPVVRKPNSAIHWIAIFFQVLQNWVLIDITRNKDFVSLI